MPDYTTFTLTLPTGPLVFEPRSLYACLQQLPDRRHAKGRRYPLAAMLFIALFAKLQGHDQLRAIADFASLHALQLAQLLTLKHTTMPHFTTWGAHPQRGF